ncbi:hypothetical protein B0O79_1442 [Flavobacteriaceae bacterium MAR_2009_75]|nr:hypothetical protein B0O79_1442 [Flavobacteriaceae bacterium MAR_2009_75]
MFKLISDNSKVKSCTSCFELRHRILFLKVLILLLLPEYHILAFLYKIVLHKNYGYLPSHYALTK